MKDDNQLYNLSRRKVLGGLGAVGLASAGAGLGTSAYFNDTESFDNNSLVAGKLNLVVDWHTYVDQGSHGMIMRHGESGRTTDSVVEGVSGVLTDVKPGDNGLLAFCFEVDDNPAYLWMCGDLTANDDNGSTEPEEGSSDTTFGAGEGELAQSINVDVNYCEIDDDIPDGGGFTPADATQGKDLFDGTLAEFLDAIENGVPLDADGNADTGESGFLVPGDQECYAGSADPAAADNACICIDWEIPTDVGNEIQTDSLMFDLEFHAQQCRHNDGTHNPCAGDVTCEPCTLPEVSSPSSEVSVLSTDASSYPNISMFTQVNTTAGTSGNLTAEDFVLCEGGFAQDINVTFQSNRKADIVFVFDDTGSMGEEIQGAKNAINTFVSNIDASLDARYALISYKDTVQVDQDFTSTASDIQNAVTLLRASGGGDFREDNFDALAVATQNEGTTLQEGSPAPSLSAYRPGAQRVIIDITDAPAHTENTIESGPSDATGRVTDLNISEVAAMLSGYTYIAVSQPLSSTYSDGDKQVLANMVGGKWYDLPESSSTDFADFLINEVGGLLVTTYEITYTTCKEADAGVTQDILLQVNDPTGVLYGMGSFTVPT